MCGLYEDIREINKTALGLRFRTRAVASAQVKSKAENLSSAFLEPEFDGEKYLSILVPEVSIH